MSGLMDDMLHDLFSKIRQFARFSLGRIVGTTTSDNGRYKELLDLEERSYFMRVELNTIVKLLMDAKLFTMEQWQKQLADDALYMLEQLGKQWPEITVDARSYTVRDMAAWAARVKKEEWPK